MPGDLVRDAGGLAAEEARVAAVYARRAVPAGETYLDAGQLLILQEQVRATLAALRAAGFARLDGVRLLEVGCGTGRWLREYVQWGADPARVAGVDVLADRVARARALCAPGVSVEVANGAALPHADASFDVVAQNVVLSSVPDPAMRARIAAEMRRVVRPGGCILSYDLRVRNPANPDVAPVTRAQLRALFPGCGIRWRSLTLAPPIARRVAARSRALAALLAALPPLRTHWLAVVRVP